MNTKVDINTNDGQDIIYINIQSDNQTTEPQQLLANVSRNQPVIENPQNYLLSMIRFQIPTMGLPLWFMNQDIKYSVAIDFNGVAAINDLTYTETNINSPYPFGIWAYTDLCDMINIALLQSYNDIKTEVGFPPNAKAPYIQYETALKCFSIVADENYLMLSPFDGPFNALIPHIYFNDNLFGLFNNFKSVNDSASFFPTGGSNLIEILDLKNNHVADTGYTKIIPNPSPPPLTLTVPLPGYIMTQDFSTLYLINSLGSIAISSIDIPIVPYNTTNQALNDNTTSSTYLQIVDDFQPILSGPQNAGDQRSILQYQPSIFRYTSLVGSSPLQSLTFNFFAYIPDQNKYIQLYLRPNEYFSLRLMFKRKKLNY